MGLIPIIVAAAAIERSRTRSRRHKKNQSSSKNVSGGVYYSHPEYSYIKYLLKEIESGESVELNDFASKLFSYGQEIVEESNNEVLAQHRKQLDDIQSEFEDCLVHFKETEEKLHQFKIELTGKSRNFSLLDNDSDCVDVYRVFNGLEINEFCVSSDDCEENVRKSDELFANKRKKLKEYAELIMSFKAKKQKLLVELDELEKKVNSRFCRKENIERFEEVQEELKQVNSSIERYTIDFMKVQRYENLSFEQKMAIIEYIQARNELSRIYSKYSHAYYNRPYTYSSVHLIMRSEVDVDLWFRALSRMFERENIDFDYIDKVFDQIEQAPDKWVPRNFEMRSSVSSSVEKYEQMLTFFLDHVYFPEYHDVLTKRVKYADIQREETGKVKVKNNYLNK